MLCSWGTEGLALYPDLRAHDLGKEGEQWSVPPAHYGRRYLFTVYPFQHIPGRIILNTVVGDLLMSGTACLHAKL